ncbi:MAG: GHKL domain-containing protein, partial [Ruminococcaceae bacterium]|nr:GHKL domain-containing protein [Oscillospiraceae bacterium]
LPEEEMYILTDGRLLWRVFDNLLNNACKYSQPGTRVYINLEKKSEKAIITFKNVSKTQLNISPDQLMERFVRGDSSRNTEGSGLGLNIAQSLTEILNGKMSLHIDGDLFKVVLIFDVI